MRTTCCSSQWHDPKLDGKPINYLFSRLVMAFGEVLNVGCLQEISVS